MEDDESPMEWDATPIHVYEPPPVRHEATCLAAGHTIDATHPEWQMTIWTMRCQQCGSSVTVQAIDVRYGGSPQMDTPLRISTRPSIVVPTGRKP